MKFHTDDFMLGMGDDQKITPMQAKDLANTRLQEMLDEGLVVFGQYNEHTNAANAFGHFKNVNDKYVGVLILVKKIEKETWEVD